MLKSPCPFGLDCGKWTGQNYENKIALPIGTHTQITKRSVPLEQGEVLQTPLVKEQCYIINSLFENRIK